MSTRLLGHVALTVVTLACLAAGCGGNHASGTGEASDGGADGSSAGGDGGTTHPDGGGPTGDGSPPGDAASPGTDGAVPATGWTNEKIGGGGFVTGGTVAGDGTKVFRTDTSGAYLYDDATGRFTQIVPTRLPAAANDFWNGTGVYEALIAWSDSKTLYVAYDGVLYRSSDGGGSFAAVKSGLQFDSNSGNMRTLERHGQIDPQNPAHVLFSDSVAMYRSTDGGATWATPTGLPAAGSVNGDTAGFSGVAFNPKSALVSGRSSEAIVSTGGAFFRTTDGGDTWTDVSAGGPGAAAEPRAAEFDGTGRYFTSIDPHGLWRYASGAWKNLGTQDQGDTTFVIDPADSTHVAVNNAFSLDFQVSTDGGDTWSAPNWAPVAQQSVDGIPWHTTNPHYYPANVLVDAAHGVVWMPGGNQGVASLPLATYFGSPPYTADMHGLGIENLCINVLVPPTGSKKLHAAVWDETYGQFDRDDVSYPSVVNDLPAGNFGPSWGLDGSKENPQLLARWISNGNFALSGWSGDDGATWTPFATMPAGTTDINTWGYGGTVAYSGQDDVVVVSSNTNNTSGPLRMPYYTKDRGATWNPVTLPTPWTYANLAGVHFAYYLSRQILVADHAMLGRYYFYVHATDATFRGVYRSDDGGATWTQTFVGSPGTQDPGTWLYNAQIESPVANHLWMSAGPEGASGVMGTGQLFRSTDGGATFTPLPDVVEPAKFGFGAPAHAGGYPVLFMEGYYKSQPGVWMTANADAASPTWISLGAAPNGQYASPTFITGDPDVPGRVWVATGCDGVQFGQFGSMLP
jgi:hypothetical protein